ncbi:alpha/beta hydrolase [Methylobacterium nonmethylotrophicum]|uniref:Alpha/beta fold hydrolase n=1 Tax=Methylobacterium nonmethylotrophicum TaxID=1141884 RepID=A0A4Z0NYU1_9HYPH|nr:alpha/beta hydrolase [Methylobacterium nonmethylotrophicum]TGE02212.1 alpha/beta fold hydrolase [Methylobacterium nonmethylotrophicum]
MQAPTWTIGGAVGDIDRAYDNVGAIPDAKTYPARWGEAAAAFRARLSAQGRARLGLPYGAGPRHAYDLFLPEGAPRGLAVFVHGGYWKAFDRSVWSHLAAGPLAHGLAVALPSYTLCPEARISAITAEIAAFLDRASAEVPGPIHLSGHSAGGHLVTRMLCADIGLACADRIARVVSISGVHDLRPLLLTQMNEILRLDAAEARAESPALHAPRPGARLVAVAGGDELPEFRRQNLLLPAIWHGLGAGTEAFEIAGTHHFSVIGGLAEPDSALTRALVGG